MRISPMYSQNVFASLVAQLKATQYSETVKSSSIVFEWQSHSDPGSSCEICCFFKSKKKGGRPKKEKKNRGRPQSHSVQFITNRILHSTLPSYRVSSTLSLSRFLPSTTVPLNDLKCSLCSNIVWSASRDSLQKTCVFDLYSVPSSVLWSRAFSMSFLQRVTWNHSIIIPRSNRSCNEGIGWPTCHMWQAIVYWSGGSKKFTKAHGLWLHSRDTHIFSFQTDLWSNPFSSTNIPSYVLPKGRLEPALSKDLLAHLQMVRVHQDHGRTWSGCLQ